MSEQTKANETGDQEATEKPTIFPKRYTGVFEERLMERIATKVAAKAPATGGQRAPQNEIVERLRPILVPLAAALILLFWIFGGRTEATNSKLPIEKAPLMSSQAAGLAPMPEDILEQGKNPAPATPAPTEEPAKAADAPTAAPLRRIRRDPAEDGIKLTPTPCTTCAHEAKIRAMGLEPATEVIEDDSNEVSYGAHITAVRDAQKALLNIGTTFDVSIAQAIRATGAGIPVTAVVSKDVPVGTRVAIPAGSRVVGTAYATTSDDRVQIVFSAVVHNGRTSRIAAVAFGHDGDVGLPGKVLKKGGGKKVLGSIIGAGASVLSLGLLHGGTLPEELVDGAAASAGQNLSNMTYRWQADPQKVIQTKGNEPVTLYLTSDLELAS
jgi:type IV secretory pathway VirB10-like protein